MVGEGGNMGLGWERARILGNPNLIENAWSVGLGRSSYKHISEQVGPLAWNMSLYIQKIIDIF